MSNLADPHSQLSVGRTETNSAARSGWRRARTAVRWLATAALVGWLVASTNWRVVGSTFASASISWLFVAAGSYVASQLASVARWSLLVRATGLTPSRKRLLAAYFEGMFVNVCLPTTVGGDVLKVMRVGGSRNKRVVAGTVIADRASGLAALFALLVIGLLLKFEYIGLVALPFLVAAIIAAMLVMIRLLRSGILSLNPVGSVSANWLMRKIRNVAQSVPPGVSQLLIHAPWFRVIAWAFVVQGLSVAAVAAAARAIDLHVSPVEILVATTTVSLAAALPLSVAGVGVREASLPLLLAADGVPREQAIALGITWSVIVLAVGLFGGPVHFYGQRGAFNEPESTSSPPIPARRLA